MAIKAHLRKQEQSQVNNLTLHLKQEKEQSLKISRRKEIIKIRAEINEIEIKKVIAKINETKSWFFEKITKLLNFYPGSPRINGKRFKSIKLEMKKENLQLTPQKYQGS